MIRSPLVRTILIGSLAPGLAGCVGAMFYDVNRRATLDTMPSRECVGSVLQAELQSVPNISPPVLSDGKFDTGSERGSGYFKYAFTRGDKLRDDLGRASNVTTFGRTISLRIGEQQIKSEGAAGSFLYELLGGSWQGEGDFHRGQALFGRIEAGLAEKCGVPELPARVKESVSHFGPYWGEPNY